MEETISKTNDNIFYHSGVTVGDETTKIQDCIILGGTFIVNMRNGELSRNIIIGSEAKNWKLRLATWLIRRTVRIKS
jgi:hypothetical protein